MPVMTSYTALDLPGSPTPSYDTQVDDQRIPLMQQVHSTVTSSIQLAVDRLGNPSLLSPSVHAYTPLSPLIQRTPLSSKSNFSSQSKPLSKVYDGFDNETYFNDVTEDLREDRQRSKLSNLFHYDQEKWIDPGEGLGSRTIWITILMGLSLMGIFTMIGHTGGSHDQIEEDQNHLSSHGSISNLFPFSPSHYLKDCQSQASHQFIDSKDSDSDQESINVLKTTIPIHIPYFSLTQPEQTFEDAQAYSKTDNQGRKICKKTLTYLLDDDFGMAFHLNAITLAYALAKKDGRTFFINDGEWDRGHWLDHFLDLPSPMCEPPPPSEMMGCPRSSRHWIITSSIFPYHFSESEFQSAFGNHPVSNISSSSSSSSSNSTSMIPFHKESIFKMARDSFDQIFKINSINHQLIEETKKEMIENQVFEKGGEVDGTLPPFIAVHIRKGDRHPFDQDHKLDYIPINNYLLAINQTWNEMKVTNTKLSTYPNVYVASDTPLIMDSLLDLVPDWNLFHLSQSKTKNLSLMAHPHEYSQKHFHAHVKSERINYSRGLIIDLNFLGGDDWDLIKVEGSNSKKIQQKPLATICTVSSNICQFAALQLGWEDSFENHRWINLDLPLQKTWTGIEIPKAGSGDEADPHPAGAHHSGHSMRRF